MKFFSAGLAFLVLTSQSPLAFAGKDRGGGSFFACQDQSGNLSNLVFADLQALGYSKIRGDLVAEVDYRRILEKLINEIDLAYKPMADFFRARLKVFDANTEFYPTLPNIADTSHILNQSSCGANSKNLQAIHVQGAIQYFSTGKLYINQRVWNHPEMTPVTMAALIFHELHYAYGEFNLWPETTIYRLHIFVREMFLDGDYFESPLGRHNKVLYMHGIYKDMIDSRRCTIRATNASGTTMTKYRGSITSKSVPTIVPGGHKHQLRNEYELNAGVTLEGEPIEIKFLQRFTRGFDDYSGEISQCQDLEINSQKVRNECQGNFDFKKYYFNSIPSLNGIFYLGLPDDTAVIQNDVDWTVRSGNVYRLKITCHSNFN